jgi:hypothetical protein
VVVCNAYFVDVAFRSFLARVFAFVVDTGLVVRTLRVASTLENNASDVGVAAESRWAVADRMMVDSSAFSSSSAFTSSADGDALSVDAGVCSSALVVRRTSNLDAADLGVAFEALFAGTDGFVFLDSAQSVLTAVARVTAHAVDTRSFRSAIGISDTSDDSD